MPANGAANHPAETVPDLEISPESSAQAKLSNKLGHISAALVLESGLFQLRRLHEQN